MSLIVEALRKAQLERDADVSRPAIEVHHEMPDRKSRWLTFSIAITVVVLAITVAYLIATSSTQHPETAHVATKDHETVSPPAAQPTTPSRAEPAQTEPMKTAASSPATPAMPHDDGKAMPLQAMLARPPALPAPSVAPLTATPLEILPSETPTDTVNILITPSVTGHVEVPSADIQDHAPEMETLDNEYANAPMIYDLPADIRARLPELKLSIHVYSDNPAERFAYINSQLYREGATVADDITLERITSTGAVLRNRGVLFRLML